MSLICMVPELFYMTGLSNSNIIVQFVYFSSVNYAEIVAGAMQSFVQVNTFI